jgi:hypothetical protein
VFTLVPYCARPAVLPALKYENTIMHGGVERSLKNAAHIYKILPHLSLSLQQELLRVIELSRNVRGAAGIRMVQN